MLLSEGTQSLSVQTHAVSNSSEKAYSSLLTTPKQHQLRVQRAFERRSP